MSIQPLLSICIPTYNREKYLKECLDSIINQEGFNEDEIEIIISDNASTDNTTELVKIYQNRYKNISYYRNNENIGATKNISNLILKLSRGEYVWLFGDDDLMAPIGIIKTMKAIKNYKMDILLSYRVDFITGETKINFINNESKPQILNGVSDFSDFISIDINKYSRRYAELFAFISILCFKRQILLDNFEKMKIKYTKEYIDYVYDKHYFGYSIILYSLLKQNAIIGIYKDTLVFTRMGDQTWNHSFRTFKDISDIFIKFYFNHKNLNKKILITFGKIINTWLFAAFIGIIKINTNKKTFEFMKKIYLKITKNY